MPKHSTWIVAVVALGGMVAFASAQYGSASRSDQGRDPGPAATYSVGAVHSGVHFRIKHAGASWTHGRFNQIDGSFEMNSQHVLESVNLAIAADSIDTANDKRDQHLKSPDFFNVRQHPQITFASSKVRQTGDGQFDVTGKLTLHGRTKQITIPVQFVGAGRMRSTKLTGVHAEFTIHRSDFGMTWGIDKGVVGDKVHMQVSLEGKKQ